MTRTGRAPSQRQLRVGEELRHALSTILLRADFRDPDLAAHSITVTEVRVSPDLRSATAFIVPLGGDAAAPTVAALNRAARFIRGQIGQAVRLRNTPEIAFQLDDSFDQAARIEELLAAPARDGEG